MVRSRSWKKDGLESQVALDAKGTNDIAATDV